MPLHLHDFSRATFYAAACRGHLFALAWPSGRPVRSIDPSHHSPRVLKCGTKYAPCEPHSAQREKEEKEDDAPRPRGKSSDDSQADVASGTLKRVTSLAQTAMQISSAAAGAKESKGSTPAGAPKFKSSFSMKTAAAKVSWTHPIAVVQERKAQCALWRVRRLLHAVHDASWHTVERQA